MKIQVLPEDVAGRIAAGEVVERPASVIKELVENSLDARATEIFIRIEKSGTALIRVSDNGEGMGPEDLALAVERHATSKLRHEQDLFRVATLGFRGEALPSIGAVSRMEICSRPRELQAGYRIFVAGGKKEETRPAPASPGTTVEIRDLFFNTPARKKFLKSPATELSHICDVVNRMALARPDVHFRLQHDGRTLVDYVAVSAHKDRLHQVFGREPADDLAPYAWRRGILGVSGFLSLAPVSFPNARYLYTYVNRRYVRDRVLTHAVLHGYETLLMKGRYPAVVMLLELPYAEVDVNVHPAKIEVRFRRQSDVHDAVSSAIRDALKSSAKGPARRTVEMPDREFAGVREPAQESYAARPGPSFEPAPLLDEAWIAPARAPLRGAAFFSALDVLGQILGCYIVCASADGLWLIDQHAAHERVAFEKLRAQLDGGAVEAQSLLIPQTVRLSAGEAELLERKRAALEQFGFRVEPFGPDSYAIRSAPALLPEGDYTELVRQMVAELAEVEVFARLRQRLEERLATIACHGVIRANRALEREEIKALLRDLDEIEFATQCPHGRPVLIELGRYELERLFKRVV